MHIQRNFALLLLFPFPCPSLCCHRPKIQYIAILSEKIAKCSMSDINLINIKRTFQWMLPAKSLQSEMSIVRML